MSIRRAIIIIPAALAVAILVGLLALSRWPELGAAVASPMRRLLGNEAVAYVETLVFQAQDGARQLEYGLGLAQPAEPWAEPDPQTSRGAREREAMSALPGGHLQDPALDSGATSTPTIAPTEAAPVAAVPVSTPTLVAPTAPPATAVPRTPGAATAMVVERTLPELEAEPADPAWSLPALAPLGDGAGEGIWQPYLFDTEGAPVALRAYLLPDPERPYAVAGIVAFDLTRTQLGFELGLEEPRLPGGPHGDGRMPDAVRESGRLIATFNGGFMAAHGEYGAMANGRTALPAKTGYATVAVSPAGTVTIGNWGADIDPWAEYAAWRQNARMVVDNGQVNERVHSGSVATWGGNIDGYIVTWRSGLGLNEAGDVLYYFAGPSLSMQSLATAMAAAGVYDGLLLDINPTWVHFAAVKTVNGVWQALPLFAEGMETAPDRYLGASARDFFYVTLREQ